MAKKQTKTNDFLTEAKSILDSIGISARVKAEDNDELIPTSLDILDVYSGGGIPLGRVVLMLASPGAGKSTLALQIVAAIQNKYPDSQILIMDTECAMSAKRFEQLNVKRDKVLYADSGITLEKVMQTIDGIIKLKAERVKKDPQYIKVPTIIVWDSIAQTPSEKELKSDDINEYLALSARILSSFFRKITGYLKKYNITLIAINQLRERPKLGPFQNVQEINLPGLENKSVPGGKAQIFAAFSVLYLRSYSQLKPDKPGSLGFQGAIIECKYLKNKYAPPFYPFYLVLDYNRGFSNFWTNFLYLRDVLKVVGARGGYYELQGYSKKFHLKKAYDLYLSDKQFRQVFDEHVQVLKQTLEKQLFNFTPPVNLDEENSEMEFANEDTN